MNRYILISLVILAFLGGLYFTQIRSYVPSFDMASTTPEVATTTDAVATAPAGDAPKAAAPTTPKAPAPKNTQTYKSLVTQMGNYRCDYTQVTGSSRTEGVVYVSDGKLRIELRSLGAKVTNTLAVYDGRYLYTWTEGMANGSKSQPSSISQLPLILPSNLNTYTTLGSGDNSVTWNCRPWTKDPANFVAPSFVAFKSV